ncbi:LacI family DNA-binding transcriptional regulator [Rhizobium sp. C4]|uniref:LacI family DNA-binding transcriptional regulator n=1 Tax=Rhizobium sp. C4 TaxID=1349800 RepID=UPI001E48CBCA|nr:LacI family DNA-binding transcriptional regulator [Rhizobium sp. C4]MCD2172790.1 LacI family transcriptional regulator [Rhizobium sp. C4]
MNLKQIANAAGVSVSTVSRALSGNPRISAEMRRRIVEIARAQGYVDRRLNAISQAGLQSITLISTHGMLEPGGSNFVSWRILESLRNECARREIAIEPVIFEENRIDPRRAFEAARASSTDGILLHYDEDPELLEKLATLGKPVVLLMGLDPTSRISSVGVGNSYAASLGTRHLSDLGHRDMLLVSWKGRYTIRRRETGFVEAARESGMRDPESAILRLSGYEPEIAEAEFDAYLATLTSGIPATAIFCLSDNIAIGVMRSLAKAGISVPDDMSVVGFDDSIAAQMMSPPLTSIRQPLEQIGPMALYELELANRLGAGYLPRRVELGCSLSVRGSSQPLARARKG